MKIPKLKMRFCPKCGKHTQHKLSEAKRKTVRSAHPMSRGSEQRMRARGRLGMGNKGKVSRGPLSGWKMYGKKSSKKIDLRYECQQCKKIWGPGSGFRSRKVEFVQG